MNGWEVHIRPADLGRLGFDLLIFRRAYSGKTEILRGDGTIETFEIGTAVKPTMYFDRDMMQPLMDAILGIGIKPTDAGKIEGLFEAQTAHLDDLRHLLKLPKYKIEVSGKPI